MSTGLINDQVPAISEPRFKPVSFSEEPARERLQVPLAEIADKVFSQLGQISLQAMKSSSRASFKSFRKGLFQSYVKLSMALGNIVFAKLEPADLPGLIEACFQKMEKEFASKGISYFSDDAYREILFSLSTLKSAHRWIPELNSNKPADSLRSQDRELASKFFSSAMWSQFHLDCLIMAIRTSEPINQEVLQELLDGFRLSVMAYSYVRTALDLRNIPSDRYQDRLDAKWDAEDEALAQAE